MVSKDVHIPTSGSLFPTVEILSVISVTPMQPTDIGNPDSSSTQPAPRPATRRSPRPLTVMGTVGGAVGLTLLIVAAGVVPGVAPFPSGGAVGPDAVTAWQAVTLAEGVLALTPGGPWRLASAEGYDYATAYNFDMNTYAGQLSCSPTGGIPDLVSDGPFSGNWRSGDAVLWILLYASEVPGNPPLVVQVHQGVAQEVGKLPPNCFPLAVHFTLGPVLDSAVAADAILSSSNGSRYASSFSAFNVSFLLVPDAPGASWLVSFSACFPYFWWGPVPGFPSVPPNGMLAAAVSASDGTFELAPIVTGAC